MSFPVNDFTSIDVMKYFKCEYGKAKSIINVLKYTDEIFSLYTEKGKHKGLVHWSFIYDDREKSELILKLCGKDPSKYGFEKTHNIDYANSRREE